uniref:Probable pectate lyase F n=1 Tax=Heterodera avenae TaxID=34510 RepID=E5D240_HETAV|nr:pectate lyase 1 [Heterodera avenae]
MANLCLAGFILAFINVDVMGRPAKMPSSFNAAQQNHPNPSIIQQRALHLLPSYRNINKNKNNGIINPLAGKMPQAPKLQKRYNTKGHKTAQSQNTSPVRRTLQRFMTIGMMVISVVLNNVPSVPNNMMINHNNQFETINSSFYGCIPMHNGMADVSYQCKINFDHKEIKQQQRQKNPFSFWGNVDNDDSTLEKLGEIDIDKDCTKHSNGETHCHTTFDLHPNQIDQLKRIQLEKGKIVDIKDDQNAIQKQKSNTKGQDNNIEEKASAGRRKLLQEQMNMCSFPTPSTIVVVQTTMQVSLSTDYGYTLFVGGSGILNGACDVNNGNLQYLMVLKDGVTIRNAIFNTPGNGIYCEGSCTLENIYFQQLCYHAVGFGYKDKNMAYTYQILGGAGQGTPDKYFTQSGKGTTIIKSFCGAGKYGKLWCSCGNCPFQTTRNVEIYDTILKGPGLSVVSVNSNYGDEAYISGLTLYGQESESTATAYVCQTYDALTSFASLTPTESYKPTESGGGSCTYCASSIQIAN